MCNRRVVIVDPKETPDFVKYWACGLGHEIYTTDQLDKLNDNDDVDHVYHNVNLD